MAARLFLLHVDDARPHTVSDAWFVALAGVHAVVLVTAASVPVVAIGLWWNANTISHNFIHRPFFARRWANGLFSIGLSLLLGVPQQFWRTRHLRHHARPEPRRYSLASAVSPTVALEGIAIVLMWAAIGWVSPRLLIGIYMPGYLLGLGLCWLQGHYEHHGGTTSHYGRLYNALFFNDGYHVEHHRRPHVHWSELARDERPPARSSSWPPVLRWIDDAAMFALGSLERLVVRSPVLQRFVLERHTRAFQRVLPRVGPVRRVTIVGGGLFPRTALIVRQLLPDATLTIVEADAANLAMARNHFPSALSSPSVSWHHARFDAGHRVDADLVVLPLAFRGDRAAVYRDPPAARVIVHDWIWRRRSPGARVSWLLLKRLNVVER